MNKDIIELVNSCEEELSDKFKEIDKLCEDNSYKVLKAFQDNNVTDTCFNSTTGYGYNIFIHNYILQLSLY